MAEICWAVLISSCSADKANFSEASAAVASSTGGVFGGQWMFVGFGGGGGGRYRMKTKEIVKINCLIFFLI